MSGTTTYAKQGNEFLLCANGLTLRNGQTEFIFGLGDVSAGYGIRHPFTIYRLYCSFEIAIVPASAVTFALAMFNTGATKLLEASNNLLLGGGLPAWRQMQALGAHGFNEGEGGIFRLQLAPSTACAVQNVSAVIHGLCR